MDKYIKIENIGKGSTGDVILVKKLENKKLFALKRIYINKDEKQDNTISNEISILQTLEHENIIRYVDSFVKNNKFCIVMEYADKGDLNEKIKMHKSKNSFFEEDTVNLLLNKLWSYFFQISEALMYIHSKKIIHRDIKCQNIFITKLGIVKLGDFGISKSLENTADFAKSFLGTPYFLSPEICSGSIYNSKSDLWMLGCVLYECAALRKPFTGETFHALMNNIIRKEHDKLPEFYSQHFKDIIDILLDKDPEKRLSITKLLNWNDFVKGKYSTYLDHKEIFKKSLITNNSDFKTQISHQLKEDNNFNNIPNPCTITQKEYFDDRYRYKRMNYLRSPSNSKNSNLYNDSCEIKKKFIENSYKNAQRCYSNNGKNLTTIEYSKISCFSNDEKMLNQPKLKKNKQHSKFLPSKIIKNDNHFSENQENSKKNLMSIQQVRFTNLRVKIENQKIIQGDSLYHKNQIESNTEKNQKMQEKTINNSLFDNRNHENKIKIMFNFLSEKIGDDLLQCLLNLINFSNKDTIKHSMTKNDEQIKLILGSFYNQVVLMIKYIITDTTQNLRINKEIPIDYNKKNKVSVKVNISSNIYKM